MELSNNAVISKSATSQNLSIEYEVTNGCEQSARLRIDGGSWMQQNVVPYTLAGDNNNDVYPSTILATLGPHLVEVQANTGNGQSGTAGPILSLNVVTTT
jgi:hypothetical protein